VPLDAARRAGPEGTVDIALHARSDPEAGEVLHGGWRITELFYGRPRPGISKGGRGGGARGGGGRAGPGGPAAPHRGGEGRRAEGLGARAGLVVCHPHPLYGGDMDNPVVVRAVEVAAEAGIATLRFNFRGVGTSEGSHGGGAGEQDDVRAALAALRAHLP